MDRVRDLVAGGGVSVVLAQDRDRFAREPAYHYLLRREFEEHGTKIRALNDRGDESPEGELTDGILDQLAKYERAKIAERSRRGKLRKAREGKVLAGPRIKYGFKLNATRDGFLVDEEKMRIVRRIFHMRGVEGLSQNAIYHTFEREGIPTPGGGKYWDRAFFKLCNLDAAYRPHTFEEVEAIVSLEVAAKLDRDQLYGIWWFNRLRVHTRQISEPSENGRRYRKEVRTSDKPKEEWVGVPVPYAGIPLEVVNAARDAIKNHRVPSKAGRRFWELSGGIVRCGLCDHALENRCVPSRSGKYLHFYHGCRRNHIHGDTACTHRKNHRAEQVEAAVWEVVSGLLRDPERLRAGLDEMIEQERRGLHGDPELEVKVWLDKLAEVGRKRSRYQEMVAEGYITFEELGAKLQELEEIRATAEHELDQLKRRRTRLEQLEQDKTSLLEKYAGMVPEALENLTGEERHQIYCMLRLRVYLRPEESIEVRGILREPVCTPMDTSRRAHPLTLSDGHEPHRSETTRWPGCFRRGRAVSHGSEPHFLGSRHRRTNLLRQVVLGRKNPATADPQKACPIARNATSAVIPTPIVRSTFLVRQATTVASAPARRCSFAKETSMVSPARKKAGKTRAASTAAGTRPNASWNMRGSSIRASRAIKEILRA
jgi:site-specific DNA recombinase